MKNGIFLYMMLLIGIVSFCICVEEEETSNTITGTVLNLDGEPVSGVTVTLLSNNSSTTTDASGSFTLNPDASFYGYKTRGKDVIDTLVAAHTDYLSKRKFIYSKSDNVTVHIWDTIFRLSDEVSGWIDQPVSFATFDTMQLYDLIDGGAPAYTEQGLIDGIFQVLEKGMENSCDIFLYNFGTSQNAAAMFTKKAGTISTKVVLPQYDETIAVGDEFIGGAIIYAHFDKFLLELSLGGYADIELLKADAALFLSVYESKIGKNL